MKAPPSTVIGRSPPGRGTFFCLVATCVLGGPLAAGCADERARSEGGVHPKGWSDQWSPAFHGLAMRDQGYPLAECRECHGEDYAGGAVGVGCIEGCHESRPDACGTCHGEGIDPLPDTCSHDKHAIYCRDCHAVPEVVDEPGHMDGETQVVFTGLAVAHGEVPIWDPGTQTCSNVYCHGGREPPWDSRPIECGDCHGTGEDPLPSTGAHAKHARFCGDCHAIPQSMAEIQHPDGEPRVEMKGLAVTGGASPSWDAASETCSGSYCHGGQVSPAWEGGSAACGDCHELPPATHARFARVVTVDRCGDCHPTPPAETHVNGARDLVAAVACNVCHGTDETGGPPPSLGGSSDPTDRGAGAHRRHLDPDLAGRIGATARCEDCHVVPASTFQEGHLDASAPADVVLREGGSYDPGPQTCIVECHSNRDPGPTWTDDSGAARACGACHEMPPPGIGLHEGVVWAGEIRVCEACHVYEARTHVDGHVQ